MTMREGHTTNRDAPESGPDFGASFRSLLETRAPRSDEDLSSVIREHGRIRLAANLPVALSDYLAEIDSLESRRAPLDAAIDIALRSRSGSARPDDATVNALIAEHPDLELPIREAAVLAHALWSTGELRQEPTPDPVRELPAPFGPMLDDGQRRYTLTRRLGAGASGEVYLAEDRRLSDEDRPALVAIKVLRVGRRDEFTRRRFIEEAAKVRRLDHPGVVRVFDRAEGEAGEDFIVYEFIPGGDLHEWIERRATPLPTRDAVHLASKIARAVQAAHNAGLVHLDLKPANILMTADDEPKVGDFDLARRAGATHSESPPAPLGTYAFMAPEQFLGAPNAAAPPADIYAVAGVLYWMLTDTLPHGDSVSAIGEHHRAGRIAPSEPLTRRRGVDRDLVAIIRRALDPDPDRRHDAAGALADDLEAWLNREPIRWTRPGPVRVATLFARRRPASFALLIVALGSLIGAVIALDAARRSANTAHERRLEAQVTRAILETTNEWKAKNREDLVRFMGSLLQSREAGLAGEVIASFWVLEWIHGPTILEDYDLLPTIWGLRIQTLRDLYTQRRTQVGPDALEVLQMQTLLGFWLARQGDHAEAEPLLADNLERWTALLEDDPWLAEVRGILDAAAANRLHTETESTPATPEQLDEARAIISRMTNLDHSLAQRDDGAQIRLLLFDSIAKLYERRLLGDFEKRVQAWNAADALDISGVPTRNPMKRR